MRHLLVLILAAFSLLLLAPQCAEKDNRGPGSTALPHQALDALNATIDSSEIYQERKSREIDSLRRNLLQTQSPAERYAAYLTLSEIYRPMESDSSIVYARKAIGLTSRLPDSISGIRGELALVNALGTAGIFPRAIALLDSIAPTLSKREDRIEYWKVSRSCYSYLMASIGENQEFVDYYREKYNACDDSLLMNLPESDLFHRFIFCERLVNSQRWTEARTKIKELLKDVPQESNFYGMAAYQLAQVYCHNGDFRNYGASLALAAESDIKGCVREGMALPTLAGWVYENGDIENALRYVTYVMEEARDGNIHTRSNTIAPMLPLIDRSLQEKSMASRRNILIVCIVITILLLATAALLSITLIGSRKRRAAQRKLEATSKKLESYVGNFIGLCSNYAARLEQQSKLVTRKVSSGQSDELLKMINSGKFNESNEEFNHLIDKALLDLFPDFVEQINRLLLPDQQISLTPASPLTPELRIYAFVRLGVDQSSRIAQILGYSVNTVYSYRNRMRNRAIDRENFDRQVSAIGSCEGGEKPV